MAIELERSVTAQSDTRIETRLYLTGVDIDQPLADGPTVTWNGSTKCEVAPVYFRFTFYGQTYRSLAYIRASYQTTP